MRQRYTPNTYIQNQSGDAYLVTQHQSVYNQRDTTNQDELLGACASGYGNKQYSAAYAQVNNETKQVAINRPNHGNMSI